MVRSQKLLRPLLGFGFCLAIAGWMLAADSPPATPTAATTAYPSSTAPAPRGKRVLETLLRSPAQLEFGDRETVTVGEVLDQLHRQHHLSFRFDVPTLTCSLGLGAAAPVVSAQTSYPPPAVYAPSVQPVAQGPPIAAAQPVVVAPTLAPAAQASAAVPATDAPSTTAPPAAAPETYTPATTAPVTTPPTVFGVVISQPGVPTVAVAANVDDRPLAERFAKAEVQIHDFDTRGASIATVLRHALDAIPLEGEIAAATEGLPIVLTNASLVDYLVEEDGLLITSRMNALTVKETRVYGVRHLEKEDLPAKELAEVIRHSIRPWSWRSQVNDLGNQLKQSLPKISPETSTAWINSAVQLVSGAAEIPTDEPADDAVGEIVRQAQGTQTIEVDQVMDGLLSLAQATISALEMLHFSDPPTGTIEILPGKLIVTQSQAAHREIDDLLEQLARTGN